jgi:hypothetical protein
MATIKINSSKYNISFSGVTSSNVSSSISGNMNLIQSQIKQKTNEYINVKNAVKILEKYSNWNGYIKLYTEVENNFDINDIVYITYTHPTIDTARIFSLDNNYNNETMTYYDNPFDEHVNKYSFGYKILYVNKYKNEIVINRYYNDIYSNYVLANQSLSKLTCRGGIFFDNIADGVVFYGGSSLSCNIFNGQFSIVQGFVSGITYTLSGYTTTILSGATVICAGLSTVTDQNGYYSINLPVGTGVINCSASGYITKSIITYVYENKINIVNITLTGGSNSVLIYSTSVPSDAVCPGGTLTYYAQTVGYDGSVQYQWKIYRSATWINIGTNNYIFSYNGWQGGDIIKCEVRDDLDIINGTYTTSNQVEISILSKSLTISVLPSNVIYAGTDVTFTASILCYTFPITYQWYLNTITPVGTNSPTYSSSTLQNNDTIHCIVNGDPSNYILMTVYPATTTTTTTLFTTTTLLPTTTLYPSTTLSPSTTTSPLFFELFGQLYNL